MQHTNSSNHSLQGYTLQIPAECNPVEEGTK